MNPPDSQKASGKVFEADCCPGLVYARAQFADHTTGAEGHNHRAIADQLTKLCRQQEETLKALGALEDRIGSLSQRQWWSMGAIATIVGVLTWLGPDGLKGLFSASLTIITGGWLG